MKKLLSVILAIVMLASCAALSLQAFAAEDVGMSRIDIDFTCDPKEGAKVGSDYTIGLSGTDDQGNTDITFSKAVIYSTTQEGLCDYIYDSTWSANCKSYVVITKDDNEIVYPYINLISYAPKRTEDSDPNATRGNGAVYELGSKYNYYLLTKIPSPHKLGVFDIYLNGKKAYYLDTEYKNDHILVQRLGTRYIGKDVDTVNITFSCNPENGAPVGSDYEIDVDVEADLAGNRELTVSPTEPFINSPISDGQYQYSYNKSMVAIYESDTLLYPGYASTPIYYAPARKAHAQAHGNDPTGELGVGESNTPAFYATGKTYQYYATIEVADSNYYHFTDNTEVFVNGIKVTDFTKDSYGIRLQIPVATVTCGHTHEMTFVPAVDPTYDSEGNVAYYHCEGCGKNYADEAGTQEIENVVLAKLEKPVVRPGRPSVFDRIKAFFERIREFFLRIFKR